MAAWVWLTALFCGSHAAVLPPPWADVRRNPCASHPRGWLMLYWPSDGKCYTIYKVCFILYAYFAYKHIYISYHLAADAMIGVLFFLAL